MLSQEQQLKSEYYSIHEKAEMLWKIYVGDNDSKIIEFPNPPSSALVWSSVRALKKEFPNDIIVVERINTQRTIIEGKKK